MNPAQQHQFPNQRPYHYGITGNPMRSRTSGTMNTGKPVWSRKVNPRGAIHVGVATNSPSDGAMKRAHQVIQESENGSMRRRRVSGRQWRTKTAVPPSYDPRCHSVDCRAVAMDPHSKHNIYPSTPSMWIILLTRCEIQCVCTLSVSFEFFQ